ncbi:MAG: DUF11 domain-containing protein [Akkermansiaceae bacterium]|nr:DUF11 domain-containing protein [Verrucomicrobiales bacterium]
MTKTGPSAATGVTVTNQIATSVTYGSASLSQGSSSISGRTITWNVGTVPGGAVATMVVQVTPTASGIITNNAGVTRAEADAFAGNNFARETTTVLLPTLTITGTNVIEGNFGVQNASFAVQLSYPSPQTVQVNFATTNVTALAGSDYSPRTGTLTFAPGQTTTNIVVGVLGETAIETNESFSVLLSAPVNATLAAAQASALIINDDGIPGQIDHFEWVAIASPQFVNEAFPVTVTAKDSFGDTVTDFSGPVNLSGAIGGSSETNRILGDLTHVFSSSGNFTLGYAFTPNTNIVVTHLRHYFGTKVSIWTDTGALLASQTVVSTLGVWTETALVTPLVLTNGVRYRVAAYTGNGNYRYRTDGVATFPNGTIDANHELFGDGFPSGNSGSSRWFVDLRYTVGASVPLPVSPLVSGTFTSGVWSGSMTVLAQAENVVLRATDDNGHAGNSGPILVVRQNDLSVTVNAAPLPADVRSNLIYSITVTNTGPSTATGVIVSNILPVEVNFLSAIPSQGSVVRAGRLVTADLGAIAGGGTATVTITVKPVLDSITLSNLVSVSRVEVDPDLANNSVTTLAPVRALFGGGGRVAIYAADNSSYYTDVRNKVFSTGLFSVVDVFNVTGGNPVPTLSQLTTYDAVLVYDNNSFNNGVALANVLADYVDVGGGVVVATFAYHSGDLNGRLNTGNYLPFTQGSQSSGFNLTMVKDDPQHPIFEGVNTFNGGSSSYHHFLSVASGATLLAHWSNNRPLVAVRQTGNGRVVGLNFFPPSSSQSSDFWQAGTDGARLMANALGWAAPGNGNVPDDLALIVTDLPDPVAVGNTVTYTLNITNTGPSSATGVLVTNVTPAGANLISFNASQGSLSESGGVVVGNLGTIPGGTNATITVVMQTLAVGTLTNVANIVRAEPDGYLRNNLVVSRTSVQVPTLAIEDLTITEGDSGVTNASLLVRLSIPSPQPVSVAYSISDSSAVNGTDYFGTNGLLVFAPGETNKTIVVPVVNDLLNEFSENFFVSLLSSTNALITDSSATGTILDNDPFPTLTIDDVQLTERNLGVSNAIFTVTLSAPSGRTVTVNFSAANNTATGGTDYIPTNGFISLNPGETNRTITVGVIGETLIESNETFFVNLFSAGNATLGDSQGIGTILNDDGFAGQINRLEWATIPSPQFVNEPFPVTITAKDAFGTTLTAFTGPVTLSGAAGVGEPTQRILGGVVHSTSFGGDYTVGFSFTPNTNLVVTHVRHYSGTKVSIWTDAGTLIVSQPVTGTGGTWTETPLAEPVSLLAGVRYRIGVYNLGTLNYYRTDLPTSFSHGTIHSSYSQFGDLFPGNTDSPDWYFVDLAYVPGSSLEVPITPTMTTVFTNGIWSGNVAVQTPVADLVLRANDGDGHVGKADRFTVQLRNDLGVSVSASTALADVRSNLVYSIVVSNSGPDTATSVMVTNLLPAEVNLLSVTPSQGSSSSSGRTVVCSLGSLTGGAFATITITTKPNADGLITNLVSVAGANPESYLLNNTAIVVTRVLPPAGGEFKILELTANGSLAIEHGFITSDDRGGIVASSSKVFVTGDGNTAHFNLTDLSAGSSIGSFERYDGLVADLQSQKVYVLANGTTPITSGGGTVTALLELDGNTGALTGESILLSSPITLNTFNGEVGIFSGYGRLILHTGVQVYRIALPSGVVSDLGFMSSLVHQNTESWAYWGIAENFDDEEHIVYVEDSETIVRTRVPDGLRSVLANFVNLSDMGSITVSIPQGRWYFHHEGGSQFRSGDETVGYADASFQITGGGGGIPDDVRLTVDNPAGPVAVGSELTYILSVTNSGPSAATGVAVTNVTATGTAIISLNTSQGSISQSSGVVVANLGTLAGGSQATITIVVQGNVFGTLTNVANVTRLEPDGYTPNNRVVSKTTTITPMIWADPVMVNEGDGGTTAAEFAVHLFPASDLAVSFNYATVDDTAEAGTDFQAGFGSVTFAAGTTNQTITVLVNGDTLAEPVESFRVQLFNPTNGLVAVPEAQGIILNDDLTTAVYLRSSSGLPWGSTANEFAMDQVYGVGNWQNLRYETVLVSNLLSSNTTFIFMEGGDTSTTAFTNFLAANLTALQDWVAAGGRLLLNAAPSGEDSAVISLGFGATLFYPDFTSNAQAVDTGHFIFSGPFMPVGTLWQGGPFAQAAITGGVAGLITSLSTGETVLAETRSGAGIVLFGGMTPADYHSPQPEAPNLRANILAYASTTTLSGGGPALAAPLARALRVTSSAPLELEVTGQSGETCVIETSVDMIQWTPVCTNRISGDCIRVCLPVDKNTPRGFYRARWTR